MARKSFIISLPLGSPEKKSFRGGMELVSQRLFNEMPPGKKKSFGKSKCSISHVSESLSPWRAACQAIILVSLVETGVTHEEVNPRVAACLVHRNVCRVAPSFAPTSLPNEARQSQQECLHQWQLHFQADFPGCRCRRSWLMWLSIWIFFLTRLFPAAGVSLGQPTARQQPLWLADASLFCPAAGCQAAAPRPPKGLPTGPPRHPGGRQATRPRAAPATSTRARAALPTRRGLSIAAQALAEPPQRTRAPAGAPSPSRGDGGTSACCG